MYCKVVWQPIDGLQHWRVERINDARAIMLDVSRYTRNRINVDVQPIASYSDLSEDRPVLEHPDTFPSSYPNKPLTHLHGGPRYGR